jgi:hypothetical protein
MCNATFNLGETGDFNAGQVIILVTSGGHGVAPGIQQNDL